MNERTEKAKTVEDLITSDLICGDYKTCALCLTYIKAVLPEGEKMKTYKVGVTAVATAIAHINVDAENEEDACNKARELADEGIGEFKLMPDTLDNFDTNEDEVTLVKKPTGKKLVQQVLDSIEEQKNAGMTLSEFVSRLEDLSDTFGDRKLHSAHVVNTETPNAVTVHEESDGTVSVFAVG